MYIHTHPHIVTHITIGNRRRFGCRSVCTPANHLQHCEGLIASAMSADDHPPVPSASSGDAPAVAPAADPAPPPPPYTSSTPISAGVACWACGQGHYTSWLSLYDHIRYKHRNHLSIVKSTFIHQQANIEASADRTNRRTQKTQFTPDPSDAATSACAGAPTRRKRGRGPPIPTAPQAAPTADRLACEWTFDPPLGSADFDLLADGCDYTVRRKTSPRQGA